MEDLFTRGIVEFNRQYFFEAHDVWEELWMETTGGHRVFYQGLIQTAVGFYHLSNENFKGASSQFGKALAKLEQYLPSFHGINTAKLVDNIRMCLADAERLRDGADGTFEAGTFRRLHSATSERQETTILLNTTTEDFSWQQ